MSRLRPTASCRSTGANGSRCEPKREVVRRTPLATARTMPCWRVSSVMMRSASASLCVRSTMASSLYRGMPAIVPRGPDNRLRPAVDGWAGRSGGGDERRVREREPHLEGGALAELAGHRDAAAVSVHDRLGDRESESDPGNRVGQHPAPAEELVEDLALLGLGDAATGVADLDHGHVAVAADASHDPTTRRGVLDRVAEQVVEDLREPLAVAIDVELGSCLGRVEVELEPGCRRGVARLDR